MNCLGAELGPKVGFVLFVAQYSAFEVFQLELFRPGRVLQGIPVPSTACYLNSLWLHISMAPPLSLQSWICFFLAMCSSRGALLIVFYREGSLLCWSQLKTLCESSSLAPFSIPTDPSGPPTSGFGSARVSLFRGILQGRVGKEISLRCFFLFVCLFVF